LRAEFEKRCTDRHIPHVSVLDPVVDLLGSLLGQPSRNRPGSQRQLDTAYFDRMAAVDFAVRHDDGLNMAELHYADILLVGVSRTSKTPTSMYLAHRGYKVANYALVPGVPFPMNYVDGLKLLIVGLTNDPKRLSVVRKTRQIAQSDEKNTSYSDIDLIAEEVRDARRLFARNGWPVIDVTRRSVEETAATVIQFYTGWQESQQ
jgi:regulator of PEP synthase PpsR (kinase-PPPase family)